MSRSRIRLATAALAVGAITLASPLHAQCIPANFAANWLDQQEQAGGHTIARHVGQTDQQLQQRLQNDPNIQAAGSYPADAVPPAYATAQASIVAALNTNAAAINNWANNAANGARQAYNYVGAAVVGRVATRNGNPFPVNNTNNFRVVFQALGGGNCFLLTSFPTP